MLPKSISRMRNSFKRSARHVRSYFPRLPTFGGLRTVAWVAVGLLLVALVYLAQESNAALIARNLRTKQLQLAEIQRENSDLRYQIAAETSPDSIARRASKLGLGPAQHVVYAPIPNLTVEQSVVMPSFAPYEKPAVKQEQVAAAPSAWSQILELFGLGQSSDRAQAQSN